MTSASATSTEQPRRPSILVTPVCDRCRATDSPIGWWAIDDGVQLCHRCWLDLAVAPITSEAS